MIHRHAALVVAGLMSLAVACHDPDDFLAGSAATVEALSVEASASQVPADGASEVEIVATVAADADADKRTIVFETSGGTFKGSTESGGKKIVVVASADSSGGPRLAAAATLVADKKVQTVEVRVSVMGVPAVPVQSVTVEFVDPDLSTIIQLTPASATAPADGVTRTRIVARVGAPGKTVTFTTSLGQFVNGTGGTITATSNAASEAVVELISASAPGTARLTATVEGTTVETTVRFEAVPVAMSAASPAAPADGATVTEVFADVANPFFAVTFATNLGSPASLQTTTDGNGRATFSLKAPRTIGTARVTATVTGGFGETTIEFVRALPDLVVVSIATPTLKASPTESAAIATTLLRDVGTVTDGTVVEYVAIDPSTGGDLEFQFRNAIPSKDGAATATVIAGDTTFRGISIIRATVRGDDPSGSPVVVSGEETLRIVDP